MYRDDQMRDCAGSATAQPKKVYERPAIIYAERVEARAMGCAKGAAEKTWQCLQPTQS